MVEASGGAASVAAPALAKVGGGRLAQLPIAVRFWDGSELRTGAATDTAIVRDPAAVARLVRQPNELGLARAWITGELELDGDLERALALRHDVRRVRLTAADRVRLAVAAFRAAGSAVLRSPSVPSIEARQRGPVHSLRRDRAAVRHHYDVSNRFYELLLGVSLSYSCAYFSSPEESLDAAQAGKHEHICRKLALAPGERLLDIGCGWGSLLLHAAQHHGVHGVGVTLSEPQAGLARERIATAGLSQQIEIRVVDYRQLADGPYDKIASIGMYEHVGIAQYPAYVQHVRALLRPGGLFLNDGIARLFSASPGGATLINRYIFPDGELHQLTALLTAMQRATLEVRHVESLREHYALTLRRWYENLTAHWVDAEREIGAERARAWQLYILGSALAFTDSELSNYHVVAERPDDRGSLLVGGGSDRR